MTPAGSLPIRAGKQFAATRKLGKTHQNVLVFVKGDPKRATAAVGPVEFGDAEERDPVLGSAAPVTSTRGRDRRRRATVRRTPKAA